MAGPKPVTLRGGPGPRQRIWEQLRRKGRGTARELRGELTGAVPIATVTSYLKALVAAGIVERDGDGPVYILIKDEGVEAPRVRRDGSRVTAGLAQEQMWRTLRMRGGVANARVLAMFASTRDVPIPERTAQRYLQALQTAGYTASVGTMRYKLRHAWNTGPKPPMVCKLKVVFDPNLREVVWAPEVSEEDGTDG